MKPIFKKVQTGCIAALTTVLAVMPAAAEDIEIYKSTNVGGASIQPNIMFILDTSGSMDALIDSDAVYDASHDYTSEGSSCFDKDRMYPSITSDVACTDVFKARSFKLTQNQCEGAQDAFGTTNGDTGIYNATFAQWDDSRDAWGKLKNGTNDLYYIDCSTDQGDHGKGQPQYKWINTTGSGTAAYLNTDTDALYSWGSIESESLTMYSGNWMNYKISVGPADPRLDRLEVMKNAVSTVVGSVDGVNIGLMRFDDKTQSGNRGFGGSVSYQVQDIELGRANMLAQMNTWTHQGYTPLSETLYEAYLYYSGGELDYGAGGGGDVASPSSTGGAQIQGGGSTKYYLSPIDPDFAECQKQFIIYLSDGQPTEDTGAQAKIEALPGFTRPGGGSTSCSGGTGNGVCLDDLAAYMFDHGFDANVIKLDTNGTSIESTTTVPNVKVATYTIGYGNDIAILKEAARVGGGEYHRANSATDLLTTILGIISSIRDINSTFSSPAVSVNAFNRSTHRSELYFTLFKPDENPHWDGNFKRFKLTFDDLGIPTIVDQNDDPAVSELTGFFKDEALSFWTDPLDAPQGDGRDTSIGGAASKLFNGTPYLSGRKVYTKIASNDLEANANRVWRGTNGVREAMGWDGDTSDTVQTDSYNKLVDWVRGIDVDDEDGDGDTDDARRIMGDPLHAQPALIQYGGTDDNPDITAYVATNDGLLHAISTSTGLEQFAFLPPELLKDMNTLYSGGSGKFYGLDGTVSPYIIDTNLNGVIEPGDGDKVYLFFGMRRGGSNIYALDVTDRDKPELMWTIKGGVDGNGDAFTPNVDDYSRLGQTWSRPTVRIVRLNGADVPVLAFAGGYDTGQDSVNTRQVDSIGRGIYIINALTGETLWRMGPDAGADLTDANMKYSIPSDVSAVDTDGDGYLDHLYVGDMGGQVWRVDINNQASSTSSNLVVTGGRIADLADNTVASNRRFYYPPSVAISKDVNDDIFTALVMTSGYRAHPNNRNVQDKIFMMRDTPVNGKPSTYETLLVNNSQQDLYNATANLIGQGTDPQREAARVSLTGADGWYVDLDKSKGEKGLTKALIFAGEAFITTYEPFDPTTASITSCEPQVGKGYLYHLFIADAKPVKNYESIISTDPDALTLEDRRVELTRTGIPADPSIITTKEGSARCVGTECEKLEGTNLHQTIYWFEE